MTVSSEVGLRLRSVDDESSILGDTGDCARIRAELRGVVSSSCSLAPRSPKLYLNIPQTPDCGGGSVRDFPFTAGVTEPELDAVDSDMLREGYSSASPFDRGCASSITESTLRSFDSDFRGLCNEDDGAGWECRRDIDDGGEMLEDMSDVGDMERTGEAIADDGPEGGEAGLATSAQAALVSGKKPPDPGVQELFPDAMPSLLLSSSGVEEVRGLGDGDGAFAITDSGGRILKI